jgi:tRNA (guanine-N7-)-methyltransferase
VTSLEDSPQKEDKIDFLFKNSLKSFEKLLNVKKEAVVYSDFFVHYDKIYKVFENFYLLKVVFGSFDKPESKYIIFNENESQYFGTLPVKSSSNYKAHLKIREDFDV